MIKSATDTQKKEKRGIQTKELYLSKDLGYNLRLLDTTMEDVLHAYSGHNSSYSSGEAANQLRSLRLAGMV